MRGKESLFSSGHISLCGPSVRFPRRSCPRPRIARYSSLDARRGRTPRTRVSSASHPSTSSIDPFFSLARAPSSGSSVASRENRPVRGTRVRCDECVARLDALAAQRTRQSGGGPHHVPSFGCALARRQWGGRCPSPLPRGFAARGRRRVVSVNAPGPLGPASSARAGAGSASVGAGSTPRSHGRVGRGEPQGGGGARGGRGAVQVGEATRGDQP